MAEKGDWNLEKGRQGRAMENWLTQHSTQIAYRGERESKGEGGSPAIILMSLRIKVLVMVWFSMLTVGGKKDCNFGLLGAASPNFPT
jgi:hypothetical protein